MKRSPYATMIGASLLAATLAGVAYGAAEPAPEPAPEPRPAKRRTVLRVPPPSAAPAAEADLARIKRAEDKRSRKGSRLVAITKATGGSNA